MKRIFTTIAALAIAASAFAQTTATDFTAQDCNNVSHNLFSELNSGKAIVMIWVMPCGGCVDPAKAAYNAVESFATRNPGNVKLYVIDDVGDIACNYLADWITTDNIGSLSKMSLFSNAGNTIKMSDYGTPGMPKVVVVGGGSAHTIFYNKNNTAANDMTGIKNAISTALATASVGQTQTQVAFSIAPNPAKDNITITCASAIASVAIKSLNGQVVRQESFAGGKTNPVMNMQGLANGTYFISVTDVNMQTTVQKIVKQ